MREVMRLKARYGGFIRNSTRSLEHHDLQSLIDELQGGVQARKACTYHHHVDSLRRRARGRTRAGSQGSEARHCVASRNHLRHPQATLSRRYVVVLRPLP